MSSGSRFLLGILLTCTSRFDAGITMTYGHLAKHHASSHATRFFTRQLQIPIGVSIHPCLDCISWSILQIRNLPKSTRRSHRRNASITSVGRALAIDEDLEENLRDMDSDASCLLVLQVRNCSTRQAFEAILEGSTSDTGKLKQRIEPSSSVNMLLPVKKVRLSDDATKAQIPTLNERQFVVGKNITTEVQRELFWYREELLKSIKLGWRETNSRRHGQCELRHLPFGEELCAMFRLEDLTIMIDVNENGEPCHTDDEDRYQVQEGSFVGCDVRIKNLLSKSQNSLSWYTHALTY